MKLIKLSLLGLLLVIFYLPAQAMITGELIMLRSDKPFPDALQVLQDAIKQQGYTVSRVHQVDTGLTSSGYKTDNYRVVFFGKPEEIKALTKAYPDLVPFLPLKISIYSEAKETLVVTSDPAVFMDMYPNPRLHEVFKQWHEDLIKIMQNMQNK